MMTTELIALLNWMIATYHANSAAEEYWFGFILHHKLYVVPNIAFDTLRRFFRLESAAQSKGGFRKIRIRANVPELKELLPMAVLLGSENLLDCVKNNGDAFEKVLCERFGDGNWTKHDSGGFWVAGDLVINGKQVQVKLNQAELTNERTLRRHFAPPVPA